MIGIDSSVLLRALTSDDPIQSPMARKALSRLTRGEPAHVNLIVLAELVWTLRSGYGYSRAQILDVVAQLFESECYVFTSRPALRSALARCRREPIGIADAFIAELNRAAGCETTWSFDERAVAHGLFEPVP